jgi:hypothetical protein
LSEDGLVGRVFYPKAGATQLSLFESSACEAVNYEAEENLEIQAEILIFALGILLVTLPCYNQHIYPKNLF